MPRTAYLIPGRGSKWGGWRRDVRRRFRFRRRRRFRSPGWVAAGGRATHPPASQPAGRLAGQPAEGRAFSRPYHHQYRHHSHDCQDTHHQRQYHEIHPYPQHE